MAIKHLKRLKRELENYRFQEADVVDGKIVNKQTEHKPLITIRDNKLVLSTDDGCRFADYYGEFRGDTPWIDERLMNWAQMRGYYWEWENPGCAILCD